MPWHAKACHSKVWHVGVQHGAVHVAVAVSELLGASARIRRERGPCRCEPRLGLNGPVRARFAAR
eukprot:14501020-Alexandrium_andersonii.AAC.1